MTVDVFVFKKMLIANELGGNRNFIYVFSDADRILPNCGWSFGVSQFDVNHSEDAVECLRACDYTPEELKHILLNDGDMFKLSIKMGYHKDIVDMYDNINIQKCLDLVTNICKIFKIRYKNDEVIYHLADYHNQFYMNMNGKMSKYLQKIDRNVVPGDVLACKLDTKWGRKRPDDVHRRWNNIHNLYLEEEKRT